MAPTLDLLHQPGPGRPFAFQILRSDDLRPAGAPVDLPDPAAFAVDWERPEGGNYTLGEGLAWYLERYTETPAPPWAARAASVRAALRSWGIAVFDALEQEREASVWLDRAMRGGEGWGLRIQSSGAAVLGWPWEAMQDPRSPGPVALDAVIERVVPGVRDPRSLPDGLARDRIRVLLLSPRPATPDVPYRAVSGPLLESIGAESLPVEITLLRPPTLPNLVRHLAENPGRYHILHFDGHGDVDATGQQGVLYFESDTGGPDPVEATRLATLLTSSGIPGVVLNACRSGKLDGQEGAFSSVATALHQAGARSLVGMAWSLQRDGAAQFVPAFYQALQATGSFGEAVWRGRQAMLVQRRRAARGGTVELDDWLVPVLYQNRPELLPFGPAVALPDPMMALPADAVPEAVTGASFFDRDAEILALERATELKPGAVVIWGPEGVGKTALAWDFLTWRARTGWSGSVDWIDVSAFPTPGALLDRMAEVLGQDALSRPAAEKVRLLVVLLKGQRGVIVWDGADALADGKERALLADLARRLRGGQTRILATARKPLLWLDPTSTVEVPVPPLNATQARAFATDLLMKMGQMPILRDQALLSLLAGAGGLPLLLRALLPMVRRYPLARICAALADQGKALAAGRAREALAAMEAQISGG